MLANVNKKYRTLFICPANFACLRLIGQLDRTMEKKESFGKILLFFNPVTTKHTDMCIFNNYSPKWR